MEGTIANFRSSLHRPSGNQMIVIVEGVNNKEEARKFIGKKVIYNTGKKEIIGKITNSHGNKGALRAHFEQGMPGQAITKKVKIE